MKFSPQNPCFIGSCPRIVEKILVCCSRDSLALVFFRVSLNLWFACGSSFTKATEITKTTKTTNTTQTAANKELSAGLAEDETTKMTKPRESRVQTTGSPNHGFRNTRTESPFLRPFVQWASRPWSLFVKRRQSKHVKICHMPTSSRGEVEKQGWRGVGQGLAFCTSKEKSSQLC